MKTREIQPEESLSTLEISPNRDKAILQPFLTTKPGIRQLDEVR